MTDQPVFRSRRELREAERQGLVSAEPLPFDGVPRVEEVSVPVESTGEGLTRRQLRELEKTGGVLTIHTSAIELPNLPAEVEQAPAAEGAADSSMPDLAETTLDSVVAEREEPVTIANPILEVSPTYSGAHVAHQHVVAEATHTAETPIVLVDGSTLHTGSIELPVRVSTDTSEFEAILNGGVVDAEIRAEAAKQHVSTIAPTRSTGLVNLGARSGVLPGRLKKGAGQVYLILAAGILMVAVGGLLIAATMLGILK